MHEDKIGETIGGLIDYVDLFQRAIRNMATVVEIPSNITNGLLQARQFGTERVEHLMKKRFLSREISFYDPMQRNAKVTL